MTTRDQRLRQLIREYRELRGVSQGTLAVRVGINRATYQRLEAGIGRVNRLAEICDALDIDQSALLREAGFDAVKEDS